MNTTKIKLSNQQRKRAYTYYIISFTNGKNKKYLTYTGHAFGNKIDAHRFQNKNEAKYTLSRLKRSKNPVIVKSHINILRIRGLSKIDERVASMVDL